jgi:hypothetical protein
MPTKIPGLFRLCAGKRGQRLKWIDVSSGKYTRCKIIKHAEGDDNIYWLPAAESDLVALAEAGAAKKGVRGAVGGDGGGGIPPTKEGLSSSFNALRIVYDNPGLPGSKYCDLIIYQALPKKLSEPTARRRLKDACDDGWLKCVPLKNGVQYEVTEEGRKEVEKRNGCPLD